MQGSPRGWIVVMALGLLGLLLIAPLVMAPPVQEETYSQFIADVSGGKVSQVVFAGKTLTAVYADGENRRVQLAANSDQTLMPLLLSAHVQVDYAESTTNWVVVGLMALVPLAMIGGMVWMLSGKGGGGGADQVLSFGESRARLYSPNEGQVTMRDVAGMPEVKEELWEIVDFLRSPDRYLELGARIPKGVLLYGPPGTGKTLLARAVAGEAGVPFFTISGSDFVEMFAGVGAARVRDLFARARRHAPCIIFMDEIDAVGRQRGASLSGGSDEREQTLNQLLVEMDGFSTEEGIIIMAATNRVDILDAAMLRPGRFDRQIGVDPPDRKGRRDILAVHAMGKPLAGDVDLEQVAALTIGFTGADLANLLNEAALLAARTRKGAIGMTELTCAYERVITGGPSLKRAMAEAERRRVAFHEAGHAIVSRQLSHADPIQKVSIVPRGRALGYVMYQPAEEKHLHTRSEILDRIVSLLGGRAAEEVILGEVSSGAADDLERATTLARRMVTELGMHHEIGPVSMKGSDAGLFGMVGGKQVSERMAVVVDDAVRQFVVEGYQRALALVREHQEPLERVARALMERESLEGVELERLLVM